MKTHDVAKSLTQLARVLRAGPNIPMEDLANLSLHAESGRAQRSTRDSDDKGATRDAESKGVALALLAQIAQYSKTELADLIRHLNIPVEVKNTDSVRDLLGRTLKYISENPAVQERLASQPASTPSGASPALARALAILLSQP